MNVRIDDLSNNPRYEVFAFDAVPVEVVYVGSPRGDDDNFYRYPGDIMRINSVQSCGSQASETSSMLLFGTLLKHRGLSFGLPLTQMVKPPVKLPIRFPCRCSNQFKTKNIAINAILYNKSKQ